MPERPRKTWVLMKCSRSPITMISEFEFSGEAWYLTSATEISDGQSSSPDMEPLAGTFDLSPEYTGCPGCRADSIVCCSCGELSCWKSSDPRFRCGFCGIEGVVSGRIEQLKPSD